MDEDDWIEFRFEEICFSHLYALKKKLVEEEIKNQHKFKKWRKHRLFRYNIFEDIEDSKRKALDKILLRVLRGFGQRISDSLDDEARKGGSSLRTLTPCRDLSETPSSSRAATPLHHRTPKSAPKVSGDLKPIAEVIVLSSDEEMSDIEEVKQEPVETIDLNYNLGQNQTDDEEENTSKASLEVVNRRIASNYTYDENGIIHLKPKEFIKYSALSLGRQPLFLFLVANIIQMIENNKYVSKREFFYLCKDFCKAKRLSLSRTTQQSSNSETQTSGYGTQNDSQLQVTRYNTSKFDSALDDICCMVGCSKSHLRVLAQSKGLVYGDLKFRLKNRELFDCLSKKEGMNLPTAQSPIIHIESNAEFILVLEKDSVLQKILKQEETAHFVRDFKVILFTARGYPDTTSRAFLNYLWSKLKIPILALTDADPHGMEIVCSYKFGCYATAYESIYLAVPQIRWLGLLPGDVKRLELPESKTLPLSSTDVRKLNSLLTRPYLKDKESWNIQLELMRASRRKAQIESLDATGEYLVRTYLPNKLKYSSWL